MNKLLIFLFLAIPLIGKSQFNKGDKFVGGSLNVVNQTSDGNNNGTTRDDYSSFTINPKFGYFLNGKWAIGGGLGFGKNRSSWEYVQPAYINNNKLQTVSFSVIALAKRYFAISDKFFFSMEGSGSFARSTTSNTYTFTPLAPPAPATTTNTDNPGYTLTANIRPLFVFFPSTHWALEAGFGSLSYNYQHNLSNNSSTNSVNLLVSSSTSFGIYYYFREE